MLRNVAPILLIGLRDYGTANWEGGDAECDHKGEPMRTRAYVNQNCGTGNDVKNAVNHQPMKSVCSKCGAVRIDKQIGLEATPAEFVAKMVEVFEEVRRVLKKDGTLWLNLGDSYAGSGRGRDADGSWNPGKGGSKQETNVGAISGRVVNPDSFSKKHIEAGAIGNAWVKPPPGLKQKDLIGIPWRVAFALQEAGWWLRQDIIWCLSGGTYVYAKTQKGVMPIMIRDLARLDPATVQLWNGEKWTQLLGISKSPRTGDEIEIVLRSGERISATKTHKFPTNRGLLEASDIVKGDVLKRSILPEPFLPMEAQGVPIIAAWFLGLYLAEGSRSEDTIQIAGHTKENDRLEILREVVEFYGGSLTYTDKGNCRDIRIYSRLLNALIDTYISGRTAKNKGLTNRCWQHSNKWLRHLLDGYLHGDGHWEEKNGRWRLGFCRNYNLERDLRTMAARLGFRLVMNLSQSKMGERSFPSFRGEIRFDESDHQNRKDVNEIVEIRKSRCREVYDLGVADEPHLFALASGILTHNSKPNPMPESVTDRCTKAHEYIFLLTKSAKYFYDAEAVKEDSSTNDIRRPYGSEGAWAMDGRPVEMRGNGKPRGGVNSFRGQGHFRDGDNGPANRDGRDMKEIGAGETRNKRSVWTVTTQPYSEAHFATFPPKLIEPCILAGSREGDTVLDPFNGSGTTGLVSLRHRRNYIGIELNPEYIKIAEKRLSDVQVKLF